MLVHQRVSCFHDETLHISQSSWLHRSRSPWFRREDAADWPPAAGRVRLRGSKWIQQLQLQYLTLWDLMGNNGIYSGFNGIYSGFNGIYSGFNEFYSGFNGILMGNNGILMGYTLWLCQNSY